MKTNDDFQIVIIGAGIAGLTAAIYAARAGKSVIVLDGKGYGGQIGAADRVENYPGFKSISGFDLSTAVYEQAKVLGAKIKFSAVKATAKAENGFAVTTEKITYNAKSVVIATGLEKRRLGLDKEELLTGKGVSYCAACDGAFFRGKSVAVVGGGNTALYDAIYLSTCCDKVYLVHRRSRYRAESVAVDRINGIENIIQLKGYVPVEIIGNSSVEGLKIKNKADGNENVLDVSGVFAAVGQIPSNEPFRDIVSLDADGYIIAGEDCKTSCEGIFAAGDCRTKNVRQLVTAAADGAAAGIAAAEFAE